MVTLDTLERSAFRAMGTDVEILVDGADDALGIARLRIAELEQLWSRFIPESEVSRLNADGILDVSSDTLTLVDASIEGWVRTRGTWDPTVLPALIAAGYDRTFAQVHSDGPPDERVLATAPGRPAPGLGGVLVSGTTVQLPAGVQLDPGGIGKGLAADIVANELILDPDVHGISVNVGGDLRVAGRAPSTGWGIEIIGPGGSAVGLIGLTEGAVATSTATRRRWRRDRRTWHHILDPGSCSPAPENWHSVSVIAGEAWLAEVLATAAFLRGWAALPWLREADACAVFVGFEGTIQHTPGAEEYLW